MKSEWRERGVPGSEQFLSLKTRLTNVSFPNSKNKSLPLFSKALELSSFKKNEIGNEIHGCFLFTEVVGKGGNKQIGFALKIW